jgi:hypothetical protein
MPGGEQAVQWAQSGGHPPRLDLFAAAAKSKSRGAKFAAAMLPRRRRDSHSNVGYR